MEVIVLGSLSRLPVGKLLLVTLSDKDNVTSIISEQVKKYGDDIVIYSYKDLLFVQKGDNNVKFLGI